ncbi:uncharacterized protein LOC126843676 [Adelges cooleyi]|uniref:uncharacterized protein LOC126843676 n=1 Tax=Adelges cooleyi TaxID=133065 RepID=UPI00218077E3|nr:uncharacterized protein LOC126843676 [Adelges cooleyi]
MIFKYFNCNYAAVPGLLFLLLHVYSTKGENECWWTGCQPNTWAVTGCGQYNRTQEDIRSCTDGSEYYCCPIDEKPKSSNEDCWWTGCQPNTWAVTGCDQYDREQEDIRSCTDGSEYYCCAIVEEPESSKEDCWWTGCQPSTWAVTGCDQYNRTEKDKSPCDGGFEYECCELSDKDTHDDKDEKPVFLDDFCWWSGCVPNNWTGAYCPLKTILNQTAICDEEDDSIMAQCCTNNTGNGDDDDEETLSGTSFSDFVKYLLMKSNNFTIVPDRLRCDLVDINKENVIKIKDEGIRVCDLCPNFPQQRYKNVFLDKEPTDEYDNMDFPNCFGLCFDTNNCTAFSYDHNAGHCYTFDSTDGELSEEEEWTTVFMTQPVGVLNDWMYSRHTSAVGANPLSQEKETSFLSCLSKCNDQNYCTVVSYFLLNSTCTTYGNIENDVERVDFEYGYVSAFRTADLPIGDTKTWRFVETGDSVLSLKSTTSLSTGQCSSFINDTHGSYFSKPCFTTSLAGCDVNTGCKTCYYPEQTDQTENLSICPDSDVYFLDDIKQIIYAEMENCLQTTECMGFGLNSNQTDMITLTTFGQFQYDKTFMLKFPKQTLGVHAYLKDYDFVENLGVVAIEGAESELKISNEVTFDECMSEYKGSTYNRMSYSRQKKECILSSDVVSLMENQNLLTVFKKPSLESSSVYYLRTPGVRLNSSLATMQRDCKRNCEEVCSHVCNQPSNAWCAYISIQYLPNSSKCYFFEINDEAELNLQPSESAMVLVAQSKSNFTLAGLNQVNPFSGDENMLFNCFASDNEQTQTTLSVFNKTEETAVSIRKKRGFFSFIGKAIKKVGKAIVGAVKDTVNTIVDTGKGVVKAVKNVVKGDFEGAKKAITNIPIVKDVKNAVELGGAVLAGDWDKAKEKGLDLLGSSLVDVGLTIIAPGVGKIVGAGLKGISKAGKTALKGTKNTIKKAGKNTKPKKVDAKKTENEKKKKEDKEECKARSKRANGQKKNNGCKGSKICAMPKASNSLNGTFKACKNKDVGEYCDFECKPGYEENKPTLECLKAKDKDAAWSPKPSCTLYTCDQTAFPVIAVMTPKVKGFTSISMGKDIVSYVALFDKSRKLPVWSASLLQSNEFNSKSYNDAKIVEREDGFFKYPCKEVKPHQYVTDDYNKGGYDRGHLTPANVARWSRKAMKSTFAMINIAPQHSYINQQAWKDLEKHVLCFSEDKRTYVVTGVCKKTLKKTDGKTKIDVPDCFWKMLCYNDEQGEAQVVGFMAKNSDFPPDSYDKRKEEIFTPVSQTEINKLYDSSSHNPWLKSVRLSVGRGIGTQPVSSDTNNNHQAMWLPVNPNDCKKAMDLSQEEAQGWKDKLLGTGTKQKRAATTRLKRGCTKSEMKELDELDELFKTRAVVSHDYDESGSGEDMTGDGSVDVSVQNCGKRIVGYYTSWGVKKINSKILSKLTHVIYAFMEMHSDGSVSIGTPDKAHSEDVEEETKKSRQRLEHLMNLAKFFPHLKISFAVGGWENSQYFSKMASSPQSRVVFISSVIKLIQKYGFDGVDVDWEYPVTGGAVEGVPADKDNYVLLMKELRQALDSYKAEAGRRSDFLISFAGAAGQWTLDPGFDLPGLLKYADFANVMTYDFFGAWSSKWGAYTGPPAPLYFGMPPRFSGKTNVDWTIKYYTCKSKLPHKINMGLPFYGRYWSNVGDSVDGKDEMWRTANAVDGVFQGGYTPWFKLQQDHLDDNRFQQRFHEKSKSPYAWNPSTKVFLGYENEKSLSFKVKYAADKNVGGLMIWSVDLDDDQLTMLNAVYKAPLCDKTDPNDVNHKCSPIDEKRWWTSEDGDDVAGLCGRSAPLYKGYYPLCDPDDPGYSCCGPSGYCGSGEKYCDCPSCKDYGETPSLILERPIKPTVPVTWYFLNAEDGLRGRCGRKIPKINGVFPTCNPDDDNAYCCSNGNYCGESSDYCECQGCVNFKKDPTYRFGPKKWWTQEDGSERAGTCGPKADKVDGVYEAECEPNTKFSCCSPNGYCGSGSDYCDCKGCIRY